MWTFKRSDILNLFQVSQDLVRNVFTQTNCDATEMKSSPAKEGSKSKNHFLKVRKQPQCPLVDEQIKKIWYICTYTPDAGGLSSIPGQGTRSHKLQLRSGAAK